MPSTDAVPERVREAIPHLVRALAQWTGDLGAAERLAFGVLSEPWTRGHAPLPEVTGRALAEAARRWSSTTTRTPRTPAPALEVLELDPDGVPSGLEDRTALLFVCGDPGLVAEDRLVLALRLVCGLSTDEVAVHAGVPQARVRAHLDRAHRRLAAAPDGFAVPDRATRRGRMEEVLGCVAEMFSLVHRVGPEHPGAVERLGHEALWLCDSLVDMYPGETEARGLRGAVLLALGRAPAAVDSSGAAVPLDEADRSLWDERFVGAGLTDTVLAMTGSGRFALEAAIDRLHTTAGSDAETDWTRIALLYDVLGHVAPSPRVEVAGLAAQGRLSAGRELAGIEVRLHELAAGASARPGRDALLALCDLQWRRGRRAEAAAGYRLARGLLTSPALRAFCDRRVAAAG